VFAGFPSCGIFTPTRTSPVSNNLKQQCDGAGETLKNKNYEWKTSSRRKIVSGWYYLTLFSSCSTHIFT